MNKKIGARIIVEFFILLIGLTVLAFSVSPKIQSDGQVRYEAVTSLLNGDVPKIKYSLVQPVLTLPLAQLAKYMGWDLKRTVSYFNLLAFYFIGSLIFILIIDVYGLSIALKAFILLLSSSMLPYHLEQYFGEVISSLLVVAGFLFAVKNSKITYLFLALGVANTPAILVPTGLVSILLIKKNPIVFKGVLFAIVLIVLENYLKFGGISNSPYQSAAEKGFKTMLPYSGLPSFSYPIFFGILSILLSFGKGILFYIPGLFLFVKNKILSYLGVKNIYGVAILFFTIGLILIYSKWWAWYGGNFWGPRFFLILTFPASLALAALLSIKKRVPESILMIFVLTLSTWVGIDGNVFAQKNMEQCWANNYYLESLCWYVPSFSALWRPFVVMDTQHILEAVINSKMHFFVLWQVFVWGYLVLYGVYGIFVKALLDNLLVENE